MIYFLVNKSLVFFSDLVFVSCRHFPNYTWNYVQYFGAATSVWFTTPQVTRIYDVFFCCYIWKYFSPWCKVNEDTVFPLPKELIFFIGIKRLNSICGITCPDYHKVYRCLFNCRSFFSSRVCNEFLHFGCSGCLCECSFV